MSYINKSDKPVVIIGAGEHGRMMYKFFIRNTSFDVAGFAVEARYNKGEDVEGLPVIDLEQVEKIWQPEKYRVFVAVTFVRMNRERKRIYEMVKNRGYEFVSYIDPSSVVDETASIGDNVAIFENNVIQYKAVISDNTVMQAGGVIAHSSTVHSSSWIAPSVAVAGMSEIGAGSFLGINSTIGNNLSIAPGTLIGAGAVVYKSISQSGVYVGNPARRISESTDGYF